MAVQSKLSDVFNYQSWVHAVSGATAGCIAMSTFYPLDTVRSRLQIEDPVKNRIPRSTLKMIQDIISNEGLQALYRGLGPVLQSLCISNFVYFYTFHSLKALVTSNTKMQPSALRDLMLGSVAGIINVLTTTPFWVVNTRVRMRDVAGSFEKNDKHYQNLITGLLHVAKFEGVRGLWSGTVPSLILVSNPALQFMMYEMLKRNLTIFTKDSGLSFFFMGAISKAFATIITYPLQLVQAKMRHRSKNGVRRESSNFEKVADEANNMIEMLVGILRTQGFRGLFRGLEAKILQTVLTAALMFMVYEKIAGFVTALLKKTAMTN